MYPLLHRILLLAYALLPPATLAWALWRGRARRTVEPLASFIITCFSALILGTAVVLLSAVLLTASVRAAEVVRTWYFMLGLLCIVALFRWALRESLFRLLRVPLGPRGHPASRRGWRASAAFLLQSAALVALAFPFVVGTMMSRRVKLSATHTPSALAGVDYDPIRFRAADNLQLAGFWIPAESLDPAALRRRRQIPDQWGRRSVILCGGLGDSLLHQAGLLRALVNDGYNVLAFDPRGHGDSDGAWSSFGDLERRDILAAVRWLKSNRPDASQKIYGLGAGIGGAAMIAAAADPAGEGQAIDAVAVYGAYDDFPALLRSLLDDRLPKPLRGWAMRTILPVLSCCAGDDLSTFSPGRLAPDLWPRPLLVLHGRGDTLIPFSQGQALFRNATFPKESAWLPTDHAGAYRSRYGARVLLEFFDSAAPLPAI